MISIENSNKIHVNTICVLVFIFAHITIREGPVVKN